MKRTIEIKNCLIGIRDGESINVEGKGFKDDSFSFKQIFVIETGNSTVKDNKLIKVNDDEMSICFQDYALIPLEYLKKISKKNIEDLIKKLHSLKEKL